MWQRILVVSLVAILVLGIAYVIAGFIHNSRQATAFSKIEIGMSEGDVIKRLGRPNLHREGCRDAPSWLGAPVSASKCSFEVQYDAQFEPQFWTVGFDEQGRVIAKYEYSSP